jgi:hypothetical protein
MSSEPKPSVNIRTHTHHPDCKDITVRVLYTLSLPFVFCRDLYSRASVTAHLPIFTPAHFSLKPPPLVTPEPHLLQDHTASLAPAVIPHQNRLHASNTRPSSAYERQPSLLSWLPTPVRHASLGRARWLDRRPCPWCALLRSRRTACSQLIPIRSGGGGIAPAACHERRYA